MTNRGRLPERSRGLRAAQLVTAAALLLVAVLVLGCGGDDDDGGDSNGSDSGFPPNVVTDEDIDGQEDGSPGRALLEWWQSFQFGDATRVVSLTSQETLDEIGENNLEELVTTRAQGLQGLEVLDATEDGDTASVRVGLLQFVPEKEGDPPPDEPTGSTPDTFAMQNEGGDWLFAETEYLKAQVESLKAAQEAEEGGEETTTEQTTTPE